MEAHIPANPHLFENFELRKSDGSKNDQKVYVRPWRESSFLLPTSTPFSSHHYL